MSNWHENAIKHVLTLVLNTKYGGKIKPETNILHFTNSDCHNYKSDFYEIIERRIVIAPTKDILIKNLKAEIEAKYNEKSLDNWVRNGKKENAGIKAFKAIMNGDTPSIFKLTYQILYDYYSDYLDDDFDNDIVSGKKEAKLTEYGDIMTDDFFKSIVNGVLNAYILGDLEKGVLPKQAQPSFYDQLIKDGNKKAMALWQELSNVAQTFGSTGFSNELTDRCAELVTKTTGLLDFIKEFDFLKTYNPKVEIENSFDYETGVKKLIQEFEELVSYDVNSSKPEDYNELKTYYDGRVKYKQGYLAGIKGENLVFNPIIEHEYFSSKEDYLGSMYQIFKTESGEIWPSFEDFVKHFAKNDTNKNYRPAEIIFRFYVYELVHGALIAYHLPKLKKELEQLQSINNKAEKILHNTSQNEKINKAHIVRGLFEILTTLNANHDRTTIAKLAYFLINGKEAAAKKDYQTLLLAISADNKQPNNSTVKAEKETIKKYLQTLNLPKEKL